MFAALNLYKLLLVSSIGIDQVIGTTKQIQACKATNWYPWIITLIVVILIAACVVLFKIYQPVFKWFIRFKTTLKATFRRIMSGEKIGYEPLEKAIGDAGYSYDPKQDIFYSNMNAWQREMGYCRLYDEACAPFGMIIDCEPFYFEYEGRRWLIEFWKGQYDLTTGCEIGVYYTNIPEFDIPAVYKGMVYSCASDTDLLQMSLILKKNGKILLTREGKHWWLTGFKLGEFSEPWELTMDINITFKDELMRNAFVKALRESGYKKDEIIISGNSVALTFDKPHTHQPVTRTKSTDTIIQMKNKLLCDKYMEVTGAFDNLPDKIKALRALSPELYERIFNLGKTKKLFGL